MNDLKLSLDKSALLAVKHAFKHRPRNERINKDEFISILNEFITLDQIILLYDKVDVFDLGYITEEAFMAFIIDYETILDKIDFDYQPKFIQSVIQKPVTSYGHTDTINCICFSKKPSPRVFTGGIDGLIYIWKADDLSPMSIIKNLNRNVAIQEDLNKTIKSTEYRSQIKMAESKHRIFHSKKSTSITCLHKLNQSSHLCVGSADCSIIFYDLLTMVSCIIMLYGTYIYLSNMIVIIIVLHYCHYYY